MTEFKITFKSVQELLEELSDDQKNFKTRVSGTPVKDRFGQERYPDGFFYIDGAYGGWKLVYQLPYSTGIAEVSPDGYDSLRKLYMYLISMGGGGLSERFEKFQDRWKPIYKEWFERENSKVI